MPRTVLSASRRTDIPAFYMPWFMDSIARGAFKVVNPYSKKVFRVPVSPQDVHSIVFWSKNFGPFIHHGYGPQLQQIGYRLFFNFTINSTHPVLEPNVPPLRERLDQLARLSKDHGPECINWRFDPICFYKSTSQETFHNLNQFEYIGQKAARAGVQTCITSFADHYRKVRHRFHAHDQLRIWDPPMHQKVEILMAMANHLSSLEIRLHVCCEKAVLAALPVNGPVSSAACISAHRLADLYGPDVSYAKDSGQRQLYGCMCSQSRDIGSYGLHPCWHNCLFCYANPAGNRSGGRHRHLWQSKRCAPKDGMTP